MGLVLIGLVVPAYLNGQTQNGQTPRLSRSEANPDTCRGGNRCLPDPLSGGCPCCARFPVGIESSMPVRAAPAPTVWGDLSRAPILERLHQLWSRHDSRQALHRDGAEGRALPPAPHGVSHTDQESAVLPSL